MRRTIIALASSAALACSVVVIAVPAEGLDATGVAVDVIFTGVGGLTALVPVRDRVLIGENGAGTYSTDGTAAGTVQLLPDSANYVAVAGDLAFIERDDGVHGTEAWVTDGTVQGTALLADATPGPTAGVASDMCPVTVPGGWWLSLGAPDHEVWSTTGPGGVTSRLIDVRSDGASLPCDFTAVGGRTVFKAQRTDTGAELFVTDGTQGGTALLADLNPGSGHSHASGLTRLGDRIVLLATDGWGFEPFSTDGVSVEQLADVDTDLTLATSAALSPFTVVDDLALFSTTAGLWRTDGTAAGTTVFAAPSTVAAGLYDTAVVDGVAYFAGETAGEGSELWRSDGTAAGTSLVADLRAGPSGSEAQSFVSFGGRVWFMADDGAVRALWTSDGTAAGTFAIPFVGADGVEQVVATQRALFAKSNDTVFRIVLPPTAPQLVSATATSTGVDVAWAAPDNDNGRPVSGYTVTASPGGATVTTALTATSVSITGLAGGAHTFSVVAQNAVGSSEAATATANAPAPPAVGGGSAPTTAAPQTTLAPRPTTTVATTTSPVTVAPSVSTGSGAVTIDEETGEVEAVDPATPEDEDAAGTVVTADGEVISVTADGRVFSSDGGELDDLADADLNGDIVGIALHAPAAKADDELGYWLVGEDGGVFAFGSAPFLGSMGGVRLASPVVGMVASGRGYSLVAADGGVFTFGAARFFGSLGGRALNAPITSMSPSTAGYWLVAADGGVFTFGDARFRGSLGASGSLSAVGGRLPGDDGYWLVRDDGTTARFE
jgi:ELWxxDGT repeat protein